MCIRDRTKNGQPSTQDVRIAQTKMQDRYLFPSPVNLLKLMDTPVAGVAHPGVDPATTPLPADSDQETKDKWEDACKKYRADLESYKKEVILAIRGLFDPKNEIHKPFMEAHAIGDDVQYAPITNDTGYEIYARTITFRSGW
eukprot:2606738-Amphidinium_carterae.1